MLNQRHHQRWPWPLPGAILIPPALLVVADLRSAHKYLGYATAALAGITAASFSSKGFHEVAGYTTAGLSLITTAIGFYEILN